MKILFQGDSITDTGRNAVSGSTISIGQGYAMLIAAKLGYKYPGKFEFVNLGVSGNRIVDVYARIEEDFWNHTPDVASILIGVNDVGRELMAHNGVDAKRFYKVYRMLAEDTLERFPAMKMIFIEPFVLRGSSTDCKWEEYHAETRLRAEAIERIAGETHQIFLPLQAKFDAACDICPPTYWIVDGIHPSPAGHQLIADAWLDIFEKNILS